MDHGAQHIITNTLFTIYLLRIRYVVNTYNASHHGCLYPILVEKPCRSWHIAMFRSSTQP